MVAVESKSKKRSAANSASPPNFVLFTDSCLGEKVIPTALRQAGHIVECHNYHFSPGTQDEIWLKAVGEKGWIVLTKDTRIRYRSNEMLALFNHGVKAFVLSAKGDMKGEEMARVFLRALSKIQKISHHNNTAFVARITREGKVAIIKKKKR